MGFEPTTLRDLVGCSTTELLETLVSKGQIVGVDWNYTHLGAWLDALRYALMWRRDVVSEFKSQHVAV